MQRDAGLKGLEDDDDDGDEDEEEGGNRGGWSSLAFPRVTGEQEVTSRRSQTGNTGLDLSSGGSSHMGRLLSSEEISPRCVQGTWFFLAS